VKRAFLKGIGVHHVMDSRSLDFADEVMDVTNGEGVDIVVADTAGRLHTKVPLMEELKKLSRTTAKALDGRPPDEILLVLDSTIGQNAVQQARMFREALDISGFVLTKLDGTAKGGVILAVVEEHQIPVRYIGLGEKVEDLREFDVDNFVDALFARPDDKTLAA
jgi:fused signal recognition particle receptor